MTVGLDPRHATTLETVRVTVPSGALEAFEAALRQACAATAFFVDEASGLWTVEGVKEQGRDEAALATGLALATAATGCDPALSREPTPAEDWLTRSYSGFPEQRVGRRFVIRGTHLAPKQAAGRITLVLDAAMAFGSGEHGSTRGCLRALERVAFRSPARVLDLGTGTGILAMAASRLLRRHVRGTDNDPWAIRTATRNVAMNELRGRVALRRADGWRNNWVRRGGPYDLVLANILARPLARMARDLSRQLAPGGTAILAGLLARHTAFVEVAHRRCGLVLERRLHEGEWATLVLRRPSD